MTGKFLAKLGYTTVYQFFIDERGVEDNLLKKIILIKNRLIEEKLIVNRSYHKTDPHLLLQNIYKHNKSMHINILPDSGIKRKFFFPVDKYPKVAFWLNISSAAASGNESFTAAGNASFTVKESISIADQGSGPWSKAKDGIYTMGIQAAEQENKFVTRRLGFSWKINLMVEKIP